MRLPAERTLNGLRVQVGLNYAVTGANTRGNTPRWQNVIRKIRTVFKGQLVRRPLRVPGLRIEPFGHIS